jgi:hypothetical protein
VVGFDGHPVRHEMDRQLAYGPSLVIVASTDGTIVLDGDLPDEGALGAMGLL